MSKSIDVLKYIFAEVLLSSQDDIDVTAPYINMGVDSILAIQIAQIIEKKLGVHMAPADLYNFISIEDLDKHIQKRQGPFTEVTALPKAMDEEPRDTEDRIAIVGIAGRFPGAESVLEYWDNLLSKRCSVSASNRWDASPQGGFLSSIDTFDADFFNISPKEAVCMDPQQRLLLEVAWHAFEDGGLTLDQLRKKRCGVFTTSLPGDYRNTFSNDRQAYSSFSFLGNATSVLSGRIAHFFNLKGPTLTFDTACSSSLVGIHQAVLHLKNNLCDYALIGATSLFSTPEIYKLAGSSNLLSESGLCHTFDQSADGFIPAETVACAVLMRHSLAVKHNHQIYALIEGININHNGFTNGLMSPSQNAQKELICSVYDTHKIDPANVGYVEAHGTGTSIGDPIEMNALIEAFSSMSSNYSAFVGSSKTNIGHALVASGMASLFKVLLAFKSDLIPAHLHFNRLNPQILSSKFTINANTTPWPNGKSLATISAFGFSGTNAHMVLRKVPKQLTASARGTYPFPFSAKSPESLKSYLATFLSFLDTVEESVLPAISSTLSSRRTHLKHRASFVASTKEELQKAIRDDAQASTQTKKNVPVERVVSLPPYCFNSVRYRADSALSSPQPVPPKISACSLKRHLKEMLAELLGHTPEKIDPTKSFIEYGVDSLIALQLIDSLPEEYGKIDAHVIFDQNTIENLCTYLLDRGEVPAQAKSDHNYLRHLNFVQDTLTIQRDIKTEMEWITVGKEGSPLLLLPPLNTLAHAWIQQIRFFARKPVQLFIPHYPGHGETPFREQTLTDLAQGIHDSFYSLFPTSTPLNLIGWSLGGCLSLILSDLYPEKIGNIVLVNTAARFENDLFSQSSKLREELADRSDYLQALFAGSTENTVECISAGCPMDNLKHYYIELKKFDLSSRLGSIHTRAQIIYGAKDPVIGGKEVSTLKKLRNATHLVFENEGHFIPLLSPYTFNSALKEFILKSEVAHVN